MAPELRSSEWVALGFFLYLAGVALLIGVPGHRKRRVIRRAVLISAFILAMAVPGGSLVARVRDGLPLVYLLLGYWLPAHLVTGANLELEKKLLEFDRQLFGADGLTRFSQRAPRAIVELLELAYFLCYPVLPVGAMC